MKINPNYIIIASKQVLSSRNYLIGFLSLILIIFGVFIFMPVFLIPANSLSFQLTIFTIKDYFLLLVLSVLTSLLIVMQIFSYKKAKIHSYGETIAGGGSAIIVALFGTASCLSCLVAVLGFLGVGTVLFLTKYQWFIVGIAIIMMLISIYFSSLKLNGVCNLCKK